MLGVGLLVATPDSATAQSKATPSGTYEPHYHMIVWYVSPQRAAGLVK